MKRFLLLLLFATPAASLVAQAAPGGPNQLPPCSLKNQIFEVQLLSPLSTATAKPGDTFLANTKTPDQFKDAKLEGVVKSLVKAERGMGKGKPRLELEFVTLTKDNQSCRITGELRDIKNSKGVASVDEEGRAIGHASKKKKVAGSVGGALGGMLLGMKGGPGGMIAGGILGAVAGYLLTATLTTSGTDISFAPGAAFTINVSGARQSARQ